MNLRTGSYETVSKSLCGGFLSKIYMNCVVCPPGQQGALGRGSGNGSKGHSVSGATADSRAARKFPQK